MTSRFSETSHVRLNPLTGEYVLVSPHRMLRPWAGQVEKTSSPNQSKKKTNDGDKTEDSSSVEPSKVNNPLAPGGVRGNGQLNPYYQETFVFDNDFPALTPQNTDETTWTNTTKDETTKVSEEEDLFLSRQVTGTCRVICFHPNPDLSLPLMSVEEIVRVIRVWREEVDKLGKTFKWIQVFENKGAVMGCSNPHPHCQVWATSFLPNEAKKEDEKQKQYFQRKNTLLLEDYRNRELDFTKKSPDDSRLVVQNDDWLAVVPFWAIWPFETMLLPKFRIHSLTQLDAQQEKSLAVIMKDLTTIYDNLFETSFPYSMGFHGAPTGDTPDNEKNQWVLHAHYYPPLLRSATIKKFMVGYELLAQAQRDLTAEQAARKLRECSLVHYTKK